MRRGVVKMVASSRHETLSILREEGMARDKTGGGAGWNITWDIKALDFDFTSRHSSWTLRQLNARNPGHFSFTFLEVLNMRCHF